MGCLKVGVILLLVGITALAAIATFSKVGAQSIEHPEGINLRQESVRTKGPTFFGYYATRSHYGGGLRGGK